MMIFNTMRFGSDEFNPYIKQALLVTKTPWDLTAYNRIDNFIIAGNEPDGSLRRFMFKADNKIYTFNGQELVLFTGEVTLDNVLDFGNTAAQVLAVKNNTALAGKNIYPIIALYTDSENIPSVKLAAKVSVTQEILTYERESGKHYFPAGNKNAAQQGKILGFETDSTVTGDANAQYFVKLYDKVSDSWSDYMTLVQAKDKFAYGIQGKQILTVNAVDGTNCVKADKSACFYTFDFDYTVYGNTAFLFSDFKSWQVPLKNCVVVVRHEPLQGANIKAAVCFQKTTYYVTKSQLGTATGSKQSFNLERDIFPHTLKLYANDNPINDFDFNTADKSVTLTATQGAIITAGYTYNRQEEVWLDMTASTPQPTRNGLFTTHFSAPNTSPNNNITVSAIRLELTRDDEIAESLTRTATGSEQSVTLQHEPYYCEAVYLDDDGNEIYCDNGLYDNNSLHFTAPAGKSVTINYTWIGLKPVIRGWSACWSA